jgi:hypothetical protein
MAVDELARRDLIDRHGSALRRVAATLVPEGEVDAVVAAALDRFAASGGVDRVRVLRALGEVTGRGLGDGGPPAREAPFDRSAFYPPGHRWAGDWRDEALPRPWDAPSAAPGLEPVLERALAALPPVPRRVLILRDCEGWDARDVCALLELTEEEEHAALDAGRWRVLRALDAELGGGGR